MHRVLQLPKLLHRPMHKLNNNRRSRCRNLCLENPILTLCSIQIVQKCTKKLMENSRLNADLPEWRKRKHSKYAIHTNLKAVIITSTQSLALTGWAGSRSIVAIVTSLSSESSLWIDFQECTSLHSHQNKLLALTR